VQIKGRLMGTAFAVTIPLLTISAFLSRPVARADASAAFFVEAEKDAGFEFVHFNGMTGEFYLTEITGQGGALFDYDGDGDLDLYCVQGAMIGPVTDAGKALFPWKDQVPPCGRLFRNDLKRDPDGILRARFVDVTGSSGIKACGYGMGAAAADVDNDGWIDLYLTNFGSNQLFHNNGNGTFTEVPEAGGAQSDLWSTSASFLDYDRDGWLDLYVANYVDFTVAGNLKCYSGSTARDYCTPSAYKPSSDRLFRNRGDGSFEDVTGPAGLTETAGSGLGVVAVDLNSDSWVDIFVANDGNADFLWINQKNGTFVNEALWAGAAVNGAGQAQAGMGVDAGDFDGDGDPDLVVAHIMGESHIVLKNTGEGLFEDQTQETGLAMLSLRFTGWGCKFLDFDNDGWLDLFIANGAVVHIPELVQKGDPYPLKLTNTLLRNNGQHRFQDVSRDAGAAFSRAEVSRGAACGDLDNDGDTDVIVFNNNGPARLLLNQVGNGRAWIGLRLVTPDGKKRCDWCEGGGGH
jgi:enediyne biosynthesis protein E4